MPTVRIPRDSGRLDRALLSAGRDVATLEAVRPPLALGPAGPWVFTLAPNERPAIVRFGQSYEEGLLGNPGLSTPQPFANERARNGTGIEAVFPPDLVPLVPQANSEQLIVGYVNQLASMAVAPRDYVAHMRAEGGSSIVAHVPGTGNFDNNAVQMSDAQALVVGAGGSLRYVAVAGNIGFSDETGNMSRASSVPVRPWAAYEADLRAVLTGYRNEARARTNQDTDFPMFIDQLGFWQLDPGPAIAAGYALEQLALGLADPDFFCLGPVYPYLVGADFLHLRAEAYRAKAEHDGAVTYLVIREGVDWQPLHAVSAVAAGNDVVLTYHVPAVAYGRHPAGQPFLVIDETQPAWRATPAGAPEHGYRFIPNLGLPRAVIDVFLGAEDAASATAEVVVRLDGVAEVGGQIGVADIGTQPNATIPPTAPACNVRDQFNVATVGGQAAWNFACTQRITIT